jgi:hypothetical protein
MNKSVELPELSDSMTGQIFRTFFTGSEGLTRVIFAVRPGD